jgi:peptidyl-tRNA hydrolase
MFCPDIKSECLREECRDWDPEAGQCRVLVQTRKSDEMLEGYQQFTRMNEAIMEDLHYTTLWTKLVLRQVLQDPALPEESREAIVKALQAPSSQVAEQLLREQGMID